MGRKHPESPNSRTQQKQIQESTLYIKGNAHSILGLTRANTATVLGEAVSYTHLDVYKRQTKPR